MEARRVPSGPAFHWQFVMSRIIQMMSQLTFGLIEHPS